MLWFDNSPTEIDEKINKAVNYYAIKYRAKPNLVYVHPSAAPANEHILPGLTIKGNKSILPNHLWLGVDNDQIQEEEG